MIYIALTACIIIVAVVVVVIAFKALFKRSWLLGWLRGTSGILMIVLAVFMVLAAFDFYTYRQFESNKSIANLSFIEIAPQQYKVSVIGADGREHHYDLKGDLWQLDVRVLTWAKPLARLGLLPGYRLDRLSGRYVSLEEETTLPRTVHALYSNESGFDIWALLKAQGNSLSLIEGSYGSATYLPMRDGALYAVKLTHTGLAAEPLNERAIQAVSNWQ